MPRLRKSELLHPYTMDGMPWCNMPLNIKNGEVERLATEVSRLTGESKTEAIRRALAERRLRLNAASVDARRTGLLRFLERKVWAKLPARQRGRRLSREQEDAILGYARAFRANGRGRHPAGLNFGDCLAYATAPPATPFSTWATTSHIPTSLRRDGRAKGWRPL